MRLTQVSVEHFQRHVEAPRLQPMQMGTLVVTESPIALVVTLILIVIMIAKVPESAAFFIGVLLLGPLMGYILWKRRRSGF